MKNYTNLLWESIKKQIILESGQSVASVDPKNKKTYQGQPAQATSKVDISGGKREIISSHIRTLAEKLNSKLKFWNPNNPYIKNGYIFNGSSQHLMNPEIDNIIKKIQPDVSLEKIKSKYGDIDIIIPKQKLDELTSYLDSIDDSKVEWEPSSKNQVTNEFNYVGRTKSFSSIPDQLVTLFWYKPNNQIVQVDFEGDEMVKDKNGFELPSEWTKFSKDSPIDDLIKGIKGMAGAILLRSLARTTTRIKDAIVLTPGGANKFRSRKELTQKDIAKNDRDSIPSEYTLNTGGGGVGVSKAYRKVGDVNLNGKLTPAYEFIEAKIGRTLGDEYASKTNLRDIFKLIFKKDPTSDDLSGFRSFQGLLKMMKSYLDKDTINLTLNRFKEILSSEPISNEELNAINNSIKTTFGK